MAGWRTLKKDIKKEVKKIVGHRKDYKKALHVGATKDRNKKSRKIKNWL